MLTHGSLTVAQYPKGMFLKVTVQKKISLLLFRSYTELTRIPCPLG